jgi:hypothetical protein
MAGRNGRKVETDFGTVPLATALWAVRFDTRFSKHSFNRPQTGGYREAALKRLIVWESERI